MSNSYYNFTPPFIPGSKVRAQAVNRQFDLLEDAFDLLPATPASIPLGKSTLGVESGSGNAYVVTMPNTRLANANGDEVVFKATHQNSGASTLQVDAIPAVPLVRWDGTALSSGDILVDSYYEARYDSTNVRFLIVAPSQSTVVGTITYATPSGKAKLVAAGGAATTVIRSDADIAIDTTIVPTWSGQHTFSSPTLGPAGSAALPAWSFSGDSNTGSYSVGADDWGVATGGTLRFDISTTAITSTLPHLNAAGSAAAPAFSFSGDPNTGAYSVGADDWGVATAGTLRFDISTTAITSTLQFLSGLGGATAPTYSFSADANTGSYSVGADDWGVSTGGTLRFDISTTAITSTLPHLNANGSNTAPAFSFSGDPNTGAYNVGADDWGVTTGGTLRFDISTTAITSTLPHLNATGAAGTPAFSFSGDPDTGMYNSSANELSFSTGGTFAGRFYPNQQFAITAGSAASPSHTFNGDLDTGMYNSGTNELSFSTGGTFAGRFLSTQQFALPDGSVSAPSFTFNSDPDTGLYRSAANTIVITAGGATAASFNNTAGSMVVSIGGSAGNITLDVANGLSLTTATTAATATGGAATLPANPVAFLSLNINGTLRKIPYYAN